jgi:hypothetical protein
MTCRVMVFGTGRCGSTYVQRLITTHSSTWIWGEHGGVLGSLIASVRTYEGNTQLRDVAFDRFDGMTDRFLVDQINEGAPTLSWLNRFSQDTLRREVAALLDRMFGGNLPAGWDDWGFKEILYGLNNDVPDILLDIFPGAHACFCFREPRETVESMLRAWSPELQSADVKPAKIRNQVRERSSRIRILLNYFLDLRLQRGRPIIFLSEQMFKVGPEAILQLFGLEARLVPTVQSLHETNKGPKRLSDVVIKAVDDEWQEVGHELTTLYHRALELSQADLATVSEFVGESSEPAA